MSHCASSKAGIFSIGASVGLASGSCLIQIMRYETTASAWGGKRRRRGGERRKRGRRRDGERREKEKKEKKGDRKDRPHSWDIITPL
jgi:hypothetical protein